LGKVYRIYLVGASLMAIGFADWALLAFHAERAVHLSPGMLPLLYAAVMGLDALGALVFGTMFDRHGLIVLAGATMVSALFAPLVFLSASTPWLLGGAACWALGMAAQDALFKATLAKLVPKHERGRAYGRFFATFGLAWWLGSSVMGWLYEHARMALVVLSVGTQLAAAAAFFVVASHLRRAERATS
jgi:MFS family permease